MKRSDFEKLLAALQLELPPVEIARRLGVSRAHFYRLRSGEIGRLSHEVVARAEVLQRQLAPPRKG